MKPVAESIFVQALKDLANTLQQREDWGLSRVIDPDAPTILREIAEQLNDGNIEEMCVKCTEVISGFGWFNAHRDDLENLQALAYHLSTLRQNPLRSEGETFIQLNRALAENAYFFHEKAEQFEAVIR